MAGSRVLGRISPSISVWGVRALAAGFSGVFIELWLLLMATMQRLLRAQGLGLSPSKAEHACLLGSTEISILRRKVFWFGGTRCLGGEQVYTRTPQNFPQLVCDVVLISADSALEQVLSPNQPRNKDCCFVSWSELESKFFQVG